MTKNNNKKDSTPKAARSTGRAIAHQQCGITLLELMITLLIVSSLMAATLPSFTDTLSRNTLAQMQQGLFDSITTARSEAIKRGQVVTVCASLDAQTCSDTPEAWNTGWLVLTSADAEGNPLLAGDSDAVLHTVQTDPRARLISDNVRIEFRADGSARQPLQITLCDAHGRITLEKNSVFTNFAGRTFKESVTSENSCTT